MPFNLNKDIDKTNLVLDLISVRQKANSTNLANINTPGYAKQEVHFEQYLDTLNKPLETQLSKKLGPCPVMADEDAKVVVQEELMSMQRNSLLYTIASRRVSMLIQEMKTVTQLGR